ncbi:hypothetical protein DFP72DRAFT_1045353 [Ephemerocybe angulata]|uniref:Uncharacterized protein n=1 Tax=Ephemerocybe angulata TaxID=980116 RepID=A0A8H6HZX4_9AGAR|nr:hypothetical protein DFP72DRAFT_1045353 [Tulosesus angulatus]
MANANAHSRPIMFAHAGGLRKAVSHARSNLGVARTNMFPLDMPICSARLVGFAPTTCETRLNTDSNSPTSTVQIPAVRYRSYLSDWDLHTHTLGSLTRNNLTTLRYTTKQTSFLLTTTTTTLDWAFGPFQRVRQIKLPKFRSDGARNGIPTGQRWPRWTSTTTTRRTRTCQWALTAVRRSVDEDCDKEVVRLANEGEEECETDLRLPVHMQSFPSTAYRKLQRREERRQQNAPTTASDSDWTLHNAVMPSDDGRLRLWRRGCWHAGGDREVRASEVVSRLWVLGDAGRGLVSRPLDYSVRVMQTEIQTEI